MISEHRGDKDGGNKANLAPINEQKADAAHLPPIEAAGGARNAAKKKVRMQARGKGVMASAADALAAERNKSKRWSKRYREGGRLA